MKRRRTLALILAVLVLSTGLVTAAFHAPRAKPIDPGAVTGPKSQEELDRLVLSDDPADQAVWKREKRIMSAQECLNRLRGPDAAEQSEDRAALEALVDRDIEQGGAQSPLALAAMVLMPTQEELEAKRAELFPDEVREEGLPCPACGKETLASVTRYAPLVRTDTIMRPCWHGCDGMMTHPEYDRAGTRTDSCAACGYEAEAPLSEHLRYCPFRLMLF